MAHKKIKVMHLIHSLGAGGAENGIINLANNMDRNRFAVSICSFVKNGTREKHLKKDVPLFTVNKKQGNDLSLPLRLARLFKTQRPDIVHTHAWGTMFEGFLGAKLARVPVLVHGEHGTIERRKKNRYFQRIIWGYFNAVLSISQSHKKQLAKTIGFPEQKITVLQNGVDADLFCPMPGTRIFGMKDKFIIGTIGRLVPIKNQALLLNAFAEAKKNHDNLFLVIVGEGHLENSLKEQARDLEIADDVLFTGRRFDIPQVLNSLDLFVLPSLNEGMSNTILEAMGCGLPVIATNVGGNPELISHDKTGLLTTSENASQLAERICLLAQDRQLRQHLAEQARNSIIKTWSLSRMVQCYQQFYENLPTSRAAEN
jgi:sugar transferase (PEP-CTERM/EpsH1 system associated)